MSDEKQALVTANVAGAVASLKAFQDLKTALLTDDDLQTIAGKAYIKRSGWRRIALGFNISTTIVDVHRERLADNQLLVEVKARATAPNGRVSEEVGACQTSELTKQSMDPTVHNLETKAATRAINRAISNLVGGGVVSADEMDVLAEAGKEGEAASQSPESGERQPPPPRPSQGAASPRPEPQRGEPSTYIGWKVKGEEFPIPTKGDDGRPYNGFFKKSVLDKFPIQTEIVGDYLMSLRYPTEKLTDPQKAEVNRGLVWVLQTVAKDEGKIIDKTDVEIVKEES